MHVVVLALLLAAPTVEAPADWSCDPERWGDGICDCTCTAADEIDCGAPCPLDDSEDDSGDAGTAPSCAQRSDMPLLPLLAFVLRRRRRA
jgi:hypothetical protein